MSQPFAVFDIDGTLIRWQLYHAITDNLAKKHLLDDRTYDELRTARMDWKRRSDANAYKSYEKRVVQAYEQALSHITVEQFESAAKTVFDEYKDQVYGFTRKLISDLKSQNFLIFAISGSQTEIVEMMAEYYGFDEYIGTTYERNGERFTGMSTVHAGAKHIILDEFVRKRSVSYEGSIAVGDSEGDISMLEKVENPIAFNPSAGLFEHAKQHRWPVVIERKNVVYKLVTKQDRYILD